MNICVTVTEEFYQHCTKMTSTAVWGGQVEVRHLTSLACRFISGLLILYSDESSSLCLAIYRTLRWWLCHRDHCAKYFLC